MKFSPLLSIKSVALASVLVFGATVAHAQGYGPDGSSGSGYDQGGSMQQPSGSTSSGTSGGGSGYGTSGTDQPNRYDSSRTDRKQYGESSQGSRTYQDMELYDSDGSGGTGPKLKGRY